MSKVSKWAVVFGAVLVLVLILTLVPACTQPAAPTVSPTASPTPAKVIEWKVVSEWLPTEDQYAVELQRFVEQVKMRTGGRLVMTTYSSGVIAPAAKGHEFVAAGGAQMLDTCNVYLAATTPMGELSYGLPGNPLSPTEWHRLWWEGGLLDLAREDVMATTGLYFLGPSIFPVGDVFAWHKPFTDLASLKGRTARISGGYKTKVVQEVMGIQPSMIARGEVPTALALGTVDGVATALPTLTELKWYEGAPYLMLPALYESGTSGELSINGDAWKALPDDIKKILGETMMDHSTWGLARYSGIWASMTDDKLRAAKATFTRLPDADVRKIRQYAVDNVWPEIAARSPRTAKAIDLIKARAKQLGLL